MKLHHIIGGAIAVVILAVWGATAATINFVLTGEAFPND